MSVIGIRGFFAPQFLDIKYLANFFPKKKQKNLLVQLKLRMENLFLAKLGISSRMNAPIVKKNGNKN